MVVEQTPDNADAFQRLHLVAIGKYPGKSRVV